jgi:hypothetical protein
MQHKALLRLTFIFLISTSTTYGTTKTKSHLFYVMTFKCLFMFTLSYPQS